MLSPDEIHLCTEDEIEAQVQQLLRPGEQFSVSFDQGWVAEILKDEESLWDNVSFDRRLLLLDAYGWLWFRLRPVVASPWIRRQELTREAVARRAVTPHQPIPDPEDLDPAEVQSVYEGHQHRRKG